MEEPKAPRPIVRGAPVGRRLASPVAASPSHKFGQIIGDLLEAATREPLHGVAAEFGLYFDDKHSRPARGGKIKVAWTDLKGNVHDLDYVFEEGGSETTIGRPRAFIEIAWRRYTKHSRNKAQEIQGAIGPLAETYAYSHPFLGVVLAGEFTSGSLTQLKSLGFRVLYYTYDDVVEAFAKVGIDASFDEGTSDAVIQRKVDAFKGPKAAGSQPHFATCASENSMPSCRISVGPLRDLSEVFASLL